MWRAPYLPLADLPTAQGEVHDLGKPRELDIIEDDQGAVHTLDRGVLHMPSTTTTTTPMTKGRPCLANRQAGRYDRPVL